ncbi:MAG TPA: hypothetical protein DCQ34_00870 [Chitinophagaceae bacterium]|nr:hypothetical protein [Chitinophagaceae bacterium]HCY89980.1 hypothetical protein [Chitinophagaceae bacterium]HRF26084.1 DUF4476 domain-containing protein [Ferruginibacter sp.]
MKTIFTLITAIFISSLAQAQFGGNNSRISISTISNDELSVVFDGRTVSDWRSQDRTVYLSNVRPGYHTLKVYRTRARRGWGNSSQNTMQLVYNTRVLVRSRTHLDIIINRFGRVFTDEREIGRGEYYSDWDDQYWDQPFGGQTQIVMDAVNFDAFKQTIRRESFDNTRLALAKQTMDANYFTAAQIKDIVDLFTYENSKLDIAKYGFNRCVDKNNYFIINNSLTYSSSKEELSRYIQANQ